ncbi:hypothetical protein [uncultured Roseovarius sp.]|uniref:hypothetical protein n=1 Tax=uncultured Roseovarius sp. TaxID=293344 RepID=UPI00260744AE|nr:hypothetical protein [uncultured Roseovarius sp.]
MTFNARCWRLLQVALLIAMLWLSACATAGSDVHAPCPPAVEYSHAEQVKAADEIMALPADSVMVGWLSEYAVMRDQSRRGAGRIH